MGFGDFVKRLVGGTGSDTDEAADLAAARDAAAALLVQLAMADDVYDGAERAQILAVLSRVFAVDSSDGEAMLTRAEAAAKDALDHYQFTRKAKTLAPEMREALVEGLWEVSFADGTGCAFEDALIRKLADLLYVDQRVSRMARKHISDGQSDGQSDDGGLDGGESSSSS